VGAAAYGNKILKGSKPADTASRGTDDICHQSENATMLRLTILPPLLGVCESSYGSDSIEMPSIETASRTQTPFLAAKHP
jgi:hypothetical protein